MPNTSHLLVLVVALLIGMVVAGRQPGLANTLTLGLAKAS